MSLLPVGLLILLIAAENISAAELDAFDALDEQFQNSFDMLDSDLNAEYDLINAAIDQGYQQLSQEIGVTWGADDIKLPEKDVWVDYSRDKTTRRVFDFAAETLIIEHLVDPNASSESTSAQIKDAVLSAQTDTEIDLEAKDDALNYALESLRKSGVNLPLTPKSGSSRPKPILGNHLLVSSQTLSAIDAISKEIPEAASGLSSQADQTLATVNRLEAMPLNNAQQDQPSTGLTNRSEQTQSRAEQRPPNGTTSTMSDGQDSLANVRGSKLSSGYTVDGKRKITVTIPLQQDFLITRAEKFSDAVQAQASRQDLTASLIFAIMETESHFNPRARSHIPAFGLMQLVPTSGGVDAYNYLYGRKTILPPAYFFESDQNIELGVGYLKLLNERYLKSIKNPLSRLYCTVAGYNTGAGNVARAFNGTTDINKAAKIINKMTPAKVYEQLLENLPYPETKNYLKKVFAAQTRYRHKD